MTSTPPTAAPATASTTSGLTAGLTAEQAYLPYPAPAAGNPHAADGPLAGLRFAMKDIYDVAGYPTGCGNPHLLALSGIKAASAPVMDQLLAAGAAFTGKVVTDELAFSMNGHNAHFGAPRNGAAPDRITGGSSSGSASVVSHGLVDFAIGSDTGGSVRAPASHCGLVGLRPTHDRISLAGCMPLAPRFDTCGWFARDLPTFARVGEVLLGEDPARLDRPRWLLAEDVLELVAPGVRSAFADILALLAPLLGQPEPVRANGGIPFDTLYWSFRHLQGVEAWQSHGATIERHGLQLGPGVRERFAWSRDVAPREIGRHHAVERDLRERLGQLLADDGVLVMPTMPDIAPLRAAPDDSLEDYRNRSIRMLCLSGLAGFPQISLPLMSVDGAPLGLSLMGPRGSDRALIALAARLAAATGAACATAPAAASRI
ncbi:amidase [Xylophilus sp. Kf1]|nr:amidase [Xylophilus sp. Kf1]